MSKKPYYLTTAIAYTSGKPHIGNTYEIVLADAKGFDQDGPLTGGIQTTGNYPGKARTPEELMADMDKAMSLMPGAKKINVHACYAIFEDGEFADRDKLEPKHFQKWVDFAKKRGMGLDFNPTFFSHEKVKDGLTLSSPDEETRKFWIEHGKACIRILKAVNTQCVSLLCVSKMEVLTFDRASACDRMCCYREHTQVKRP